MAPIQASTRKPQDDQTAILFRKRNTSLRAAELEATIRKRLDFYISSEQILKQEPPDPTNNGNNEDLRFKIRPSLGSPQKYLTTANDPNQTPLKGRVKADQMEESLGAKTAHKTLNNENLSQLVFPRKRSIAQEGQPGSLGAISPLPQHQVLKRQRLTNKLEATKNNVDQGQRQQQT